MIVFPHVPKTGGSSIRSALRIQFGERLFLDYNHNPMRRVEIRPKPFTEDEIIKMDILGKYDVIYGHFAADLYNSIPGRVAMFFRDPAERLLSNFYYQSSKEESGQSDLFEFLHRPNQINFYSRYLGSLSIENITFVGITEEFTLSIKLFNKMFGVSLPVLKERETKWTFPTYMTNIINDTQYANRIIYESARAKFRMLCNIHLGSSLL